MEYRVDNFNTDIDKKMSSALVDAIKEGNTSQVQRLLASNLLPKQQMQIAKDMEAQAQAQQEKANIFSILSGNGE